MGKKLVDAGFGSGRMGGPPDGWELKAAYDSLKPIFRLSRRSGSRALLITGGGNPNCVGWASHRFRLTAGNTYRMRVVFSISRDLNPNLNLIFAYYDGETDNKFNDGIRMFKRREDGWIEGENSFFVPGEGEITGDIRIYFRYSAKGKAWIKSVTFEEDDPIPPRPVRCMCTCGGMEQLDNWAAVLDHAGKQKVDLALLPETFNGLTPEPLDGPACKLMSGKAKEYGIYVAGTLQLRAEDGLVYNACMLYDRKGEEVGRYYKNHPYSPEAFQGVTPGTDVSVCETDFGKVGMIICYDSWFTDVTELLALKGAEIILFPCAGCYTSLMPARAADNGVRMVVSTLGCGLGIWDTTGADITNPNSDPTRCAISESQVSGIEQAEINGIKTLTATLDLSQSHSPHWWGGPMLSAPGGRRNRRDQKRLLTREIEREQLRWWEE